MISFFDKLLTVLRCDLFTSLRYKSTWPIAIFGSLVELAAFYYLAHSVGPDYRPQGMDYFAFLVIGTGFYGFFISGMSAFVRTISEAQKMGTLEVLLTTPTPASMLMVLTAISAFAGRAIHLLFYVLVGIVLFRAYPANPNYLACLLVLVLSTVIVVAIAMLAAAAQVATQQGGIILWLMGSLSWLISGTVFPVTALPRPLRLLSALMPITHSLDALRMALFQRASWAELAQPVFWLLLFALTLVPFSLLVFTYVLRQARVSGTLSLY
jgi:ABC-2 type transport system permease protein